MGARVIVIGGGVGGMSAAHELVDRGFDVTVYELRGIPGGKARSMDALPGKGGRRALPGEHGFRFFPGFYRHLPDTMSRIPFGSNRQGVLDNLVAATQLQIAQQDGRPELVGPAHFPVTPPDWEAALRFAVGLAIHVDVPFEDRAHFVGLLVTLMAACDERRLGQFERQSWWEFSDAEHRSEAYRRFLADGLTRTLVAARAREMSARTGGAILLQLLQDLSRPGGHADRVLDAPTNDAWLDPWLEHLRARGVDYRIRHEVTAIEGGAGRVIAIAGRRIRADGTPGAPFRDSADFYVAAVPAEVLRERIALGSLKASSPQLAALDRLVVRWMNGVMYYLRRDVPLVHGHTIFIDSAWALTAISQRQFWPRTDLHAMGDGNVSGILSVDISDWAAPGAFSAKGKIARDCSGAEVAEEVWDQLKAALDDGRTVLDDADRVAWFLDPSIVEPNPSRVMNLEPLLVNTAGSWADRPDAALPGVRNLVLAADFVRTSTDLATMEGANEAARRAVNAILQASGSDAEPCGVWRLREPGGLPFAVARQADRLVWRLFGPRVGPPAPVRLTSDDRLALAPVPRRP